MAAESGDKDTVEHLVDNKADVNIKDKNGVTLLVMPHKLISCFWFQYATAVFAQPAPSEFATIYTVACFDEQVSAFCSIEAVPHT